MSWDNIEVQDSTDPQSGWIRADVKHFKCNSQYSLKVQIFNREEDETVDGCYEAATQQTFSQVPSLSSYFDEKVTPDMEPDRNVTGGRVYPLRKVFKDRDFIECLDRVIIESREEGSEDWTEDRALTGLKAEDYNSGYPVTGSPDIGREQVRITYRPIGLNSTFHCELNRIRPFYK